jgi:hypothetical protein
MQEGYASAKPMRQARREEVRAYWWACEVPGRCRPYSGSLGALKVSPVRSVCILRRSCLFLMLLLICLNRTSQLRTA